MANDIKLQSPEGKHPVDENLRPILVGGKATAIETAQSGNGAKVAGNLEITGDVEVAGDIFGNIKDIEFDSLNINKVNEQTTTSLEKCLSIDYDHTEISASGQTVRGTGLDIDMNCESVTHVGTVVQTGIDIDMVAGTDGTQANYGLDITLSGSDSATGLRIDTTAGTQGIGIDIDNVNGGQDFINRSSANTSDYFIIKTIAAGDTTLTTVDTSVGATAHLNMVADGNFTVDAAGDISLDAAGGDVTILQADVTIPVDKKVIFGDAGEHIVGDGTDFDIVSSGRITNTATGAYKVDSGAGIILDSATGAYQMHGAGTASQFSVDDSAYAGMILGYTTVGIDASSDSYDLVNAMTVVDDAMKVKFVAPPSGVVEIFASLYWDTARRLPVLGLSDQDASTGYRAISFPNTTDVTNEHRVAMPPNALADTLLNKYWVVTGLTPGTAYEWWYAAGTTVADGGVLRWGGTTAGDYPPFIMKATALPTAVADFAVYG